MVVQDYKSNTLEADAGKSEVLSHPKPHNKLKVGLGYIILHALFLWKNTVGKKGQNPQRFIFKVP